MELHNDMKDGHSDTEGWIYKIFEQLAGETASSLLLGWWNLLWWLIRGFEEKTWRCLFCMCR